MAQHYELRSKASVFFRILLITSPRCPQSSWRERCHVKLEVNLMKLFVATESRASFAIFADSKRVEQFHTSTILQIALSRLHQKVDEKLLHKDLYLDSEDLMTIPSTMTNTLIWRSAGRTATRCLWWWQMFLILFIIQMVLRRRGRVFSAAGRLRRHLTPWPSMSNWTSWELTELSKRRFSGKLTCQSVSMFSEGLYCQHFGRSVFWPWYESAVLQGIPSSVLYDSNFSILFLNVSFCAVPAMAIYL